MTSSGAADDLKAGPRFSGTQVSGRETTLLPPFDLGDLASQSCYPRELTRAEPTPKGARAELVAISEAAGGAEFVRFKLCGS